MKRLFLATVSRPTALLRPAHPFKIAPIPARKSRNFGTTQRRPFLDECLVQTHSLICGIHDITGLPWAATLPLVAFLVSSVVIYPVYFYNHRLNIKRLRLYPQLQKSAVAIEKEVRQEHGEKSPQERQSIRNRAVNLLWKQTLKQNGAQKWKTHILHINIPVFFTVMETIRRMTGTEDGMLSLFVNPLTALIGMHNPGTGTLDELIPIEPSLATEGMLWFDNLMIPDPFSILPLAWLGMIYVMLWTRRGISHKIALSSSYVTQAESKNQRKIKFLAIGAFAILPATLMFPSAMVLYWLSSSLAAVTVPILWDYISRIPFVRMPRSPGNSKPGKEEQRSKPKVQRIMPYTPGQKKNKKK